MSKAVTATLKIQKWGNSLAVRIPAKVARSAHFAEGQPVVVAAQEIGVAIKPIGAPKLTLTQKLARFDPKKHRGEMMPTGRIGAEVF